LVRSYTQSVSELRGWSDSDTFMAPYVEHPIECSIFGYIERQNDSKYRLVQWGDGREYWVSMLRSMAFGAIWHTQWKIGPASEASIANVMLHASPGFITLVDTPTLGLCTMLAEDAADRYLIMGLENRINFSDFSEVVFVYALKIALVAGAKLTMLHVAETPDAERQDFPAVRDTLER
jgi:hypothetical protein